MEIRKCLRCGKIFAYSHNPICLDCHKEEEEVFEIVRLYLKENPSSGLTKIAEETEVSADRILKYVREGRIIMTDGMAEDVRCDRCGAEIKSGRFCEECIVDLRQGFAIPEEENKKSGKMHSTFRQK